MVRRVIEALCLLILASVTLFSLSVALAAPPRAAATLDTAGRYTVTLNPDQAWLSAEISVAGGETVELGPTASAAVLELEGTTSATGPLWLVVRAAVEDQTGVTWTFSLDPQLIPDPPPRFVERLAPRRRGKDGRWRE